MIISDLIGSSPKFRALLDQINIGCAGGLRGPASGRNGYRQGVIAQAIHDIGPRRQNRFVAINCAAIPAALFESELFGHERGAFTGSRDSDVRAVSSSRSWHAVSGRNRGSSHRASAEASSACCRNGSLSAWEGPHRQVDVRLIAATNQDLWRMVQEKQISG